MSGRRRSHLCIVPKFAPGDPRPDGYLEWYEWAAVQHKAGLRQKRCVGCAKWKFPQELSEVTVTWSATASCGRRRQQPAVVQMAGVLCKDCHAAREGA